MAKSYQYQSLPSPKSFRILWLFDGADRDPLRCFVFLLGARRGVDRSNDPKDQLRYYPEPISDLFREAADGGIVIEFDALSYTWGNPYSDNDTRCNQSRDWLNPGPLIVDYI